MRKVIYDDARAFALDAAAANVAKALADRKIAMDAVSKVVAPGALDGVKSADAAYRLGLDALGVNLRGVPTSAYAGLYAAVRRIGTTGPADRAASADLAKQFPAIARIKRI